MTPWEREERAHRQAAGLAILTIVALTLFAGAIAFTLWLMGWR